MSDNFREEIILGFWKKIIIQELITLNLLRVRGYLLWNNF